ncbi:MULTISPECIES: helix-turn-helix domain-containing protein [unclassified Frondihabitans]|uniref:ArsR/SmtB family transcription factor n=1 Tax=unclassified Frondihabitans TaxID=2626248 RepID=UPI000F4DC277|nr:MULTISPECIES: helix-turn-helix domain-containing protein [unclassified Frondihabitans]RPE74241.1 helix-turn-helix protein [Frondihabitans sp. PhB153]RPF02671.1 helix-turn-helix protein [Frondihabitans sp. PhB161]
MDPLESLRATAHPLRLRMLSLVTAAALSAAEVARELDVTQANASYHLRLLERAGLVRVVERTRVRGGDAKRYRHESSAKPFVPLDESEDPQAVDPASFRHYVAVLAAELQRRAEFPADGPRVSTDAELWLDAGEWAAIVQAVGDASARLHAKALPARTAGAVRVSMSAALFQMDRP